MNEGYIPGVDEAPLDGTSYVRKNGQWVPGSGGGGATNTKELTDMPDQVQLDQASDGDKLVYDKTNNRYILVKATTIQGIEDPENVTISFDDATRTITLDAVSDTYTVVSNTGETFSKASDSIVIPDTEGLHAVYYDMDGVLQTSVNNSRSVLYDLFQINIAVSFVSWSVQDARANNVTNALKGRDMSNAAWVKNAFDQEIAILSGLQQNNDPSQGGTITPGGAVDSDAQFGVLAGYTFWTDSKYQSLERLVGADWDVYYNDGSNQRYLTKTAFAALQDTDIGAGTGRLLHNNDGVPIPAPTGNHVWYFIAISNDILQEKRLISIMGNGQYGATATARNNFETELALAEDQVVRQELKIIYGVLFQTGSYSNTLQSRIRDFFVVIDEKTGVAVAPVPEELLDGSETSLHSHNRDELVHKEGAETIGGPKTFNEPVTFENGVDPGQTIVSALGVRIKRIISYVTAEYSVNPQLVFQLIEDGTSKIVGFFRGNGNFIISPDLEEADTGERVQIIGRAKVQVTDEGAFDVKDGSGNSKYKVDTEKGQTVLNGNAIDTTMVSAANVWRDTGISSNGGFGGRIVMVHSSAHYGENAGQSNAEVWMIRCSFGGDNITAVAVSQTGDTATYGIQFQVNATTKNIEFKSKHSAINCYVRITTNK